MGLQRGDHNLPALTVLALLLTGPRHAYEMHRMIIDTHKDFVTGLPRSMYHAVDRLLRDELIAVHAVLRDGPRPERTVYALTDAGRAELNDQVERLLSTPNHDATLFVAALSFIGVLPRERAVACLRARSVAIADQLRRLDGGMASVPSSVPRLLLVEGEFERARLGDERAWVDGLVGEIEDGRLPWPERLERLVDLLPPGAIPGDPAAEEPRMG